MNFLFKIYVINKNKIGINIKFKRYKKKKLKKKIGENKFYEKANFYQLVLDPHKTESLKMGQFCEFMDLWPCKLGHQCFDLPAKWDNVFVP